jgi:hypothetical protein
MRWTLAITGIGIIAAGCGGEHHLQQQHGRRRGLEHHHDNDVGRQRQGVCKPPP